MCKRLLHLSSLMAIIAVVAGCGLPDRSETAQLAFEAQMNVDSGQRFHVSLGVRNVGQARYRDSQAFNAVMQLQNDAGEDLGSIWVTTLWELAPGNAGWPAAYASRLPAGAYQLTWGARGGDSIVVDFTIVELDAWLYLGQQSIRSTTGEMPGDDRQYGALQSLVDLARVNLAQRLGVEPEAVAVQSVEETEFPDASLGAPEPDRLYAQAITPGHTIKLVVAGQAYEYHASDERLVLIPPGTGAPQGRITVDGVQVTAGEQIDVQGQSTLPDDTCLGSELWADGEVQAWWPGEICVPVQDGVWQMNVPLGANEVPAELDPMAQYVLRVFQQNGPDIVSVFAFDLSGPSTPQP
jgi:hypothetical protein